MTKAHGKKYLEAAKLVESAKLEARLSGWHEQMATDANGRFSFPTVPAGEYTLVVRKDGFQVVEQPVVVRSGTVNPLTIALPVGAVSETVTVSSGAERINRKSSTTESLVTRDQLDRTPGALRTNSLDMVTQFVPGSYLVHDQLHIRGGHQVSWLVDGVPVPNTNIAGNVGPQFDPKDIDTIEIQRGGYTGIWRTDVWRFQRGPALGVGTRPGSGSGGELRHLPRDQRSIKSRRPYGSNRLLRERECESD